MHISVGSNQIQKYQTPKALGERYTYTNGKFLWNYSKFLVNQTPPKLKDKSRDEPMEIQTPRQVRVPPIL